MTVRRANSGDAGEIARVHVATWQVIYRGHMPDDFLDGLSVESRMNAWSKAAGDPDYTLLVAEREGELVGFVGAAADRDDPTRGEIQAIYVHPRHWDQGVGAALMTSATEALRRRGFREVMLWVLRENDRARSFYRKGGWLTDGAERTEDFGAEITEVRYMLSI